MIKTLKLYFVDSALAASLIGIRDVSQVMAAFDDVEQLTIEMLRQALHKRVDEVDFEQVKADVKPFLSNVDGLEIWSDEYFHQLGSADA